MSVAARVRRPRAPPFLDPPGYGRHRPEATLYEARVDWFPWLANPSLVGALRGDPRFEEIVGRLNLPATPPR